jgi:hypothetical protein
VRPQWRGGLLPALHARWLPAPWQLPRWLEGGRSALEGVIDISGGGGLGLTATHARTRAAGSGARHCGRLTLRAAAFGAAAGASADAAYKLKLAPEGLTLGAAVGAARPAPAVAFLKLRDRGSGASLRLTLGLAARYAAAELALPDALVTRGRAPPGDAPDGEWRAALRWADGRVRAATLTRTVAY